ncbi:MAG: TonB-dependent receptor plug domain-containing protein, partial [Novosphingobium sp.]
MRAFLALLCAVTVTTPAMAQDRQPVDLPAGTLGNAVAMLATQASVSVRIESDSLWNRPVASLRGQMSAQEALDRLLKGSGAKAVRLSSNGWSIRPMRPPLRRASAAPRPASPAVMGSPPAPAPIIVTASKRDTMLTRFPGMVNLIDGPDLAFGGTQGTDGLITRIASLSSTHLGSGRNKLFIRGIADSSFTGPTQATVGQYFGDLRLSYNAPDPDLRLYDIGSVEILEGPQGTLYGAGSLGGIIRVVPNAPDLQRTGADLSGGLSATQHGDPGADIGGTINLPLIQERVGLRLTAYAVTEGGYIDDIGRGRNDINRTHVEGGRATIRIDAGNGWTIDIGGILQNNHGADNQYADPALPPLTRSGTIGGGFDARYRMASLLVEKRWGGMQLHSSTAYVRQKLDERYDATVPDSPPQLFRQH